MTLFVLYLWNQGGDGMGVWNENDVNIGAVWEDLISYFFDVFAGDLFEREV